MRVVGVLLTVVALATLSCGPSKPAENRGAAVAAARKDLAGEVALQIRGLAAFVPIAGGYKSVFLSPSSEPHVPLLTVATTDIDETNTSVPDFIVPGPDGAGLAVWTFTWAGIDPGNVTNKLLDVNQDDLVNGDSDYSKLAWIPRMRDIFGAPQDTDPAKLSEAPASADWTVGKMVPVFDSDENKVHPWTIGKRVKTAVADGALLTVSLSKPAQPLSVKITRNKLDEVILVRGGATVFVTDYPKRVPKLGEDMHHFHHFYDLIANGPHGFSPVNATGGGPSLKPSRCAPSLFP